MKKLLGCLAACLCAGSVNAAVITFDGMGLNTADPVTVDGFVFDYINNDGWAIGNPEVELSNELGNGTEVITCRDTRDGDCSIVMTSAGGGAFSLQSFDGADGLFGVGGRTIEVIGTLVGGGTVTDVFTTVADAFTTYSLSSAFSNLASVEFHGFGPGDDMIAFDNIHVTEVPEPAGIALLALSLAGIGIWRKNRTIIYSIAWPAAGLRRPRLVRGRLALGVAQTLSENSNDAGDKCTRL